MESINKTALVTGATSSIGYHLTKPFAKHRYNPDLVAKEKDLRRVSDEIVNEFVTQQVIIIPKDLFIANTKYLNAQ